MAKTKVKPVAFTFEGKDFECDPAACHNYRILKAIAKGETNPSGYFSALEAVFCGHDEEYADMLGGDQETVDRLLAAAFEAVGAKN